MITIGLPKGLFYYQHNVLWESFFRQIGCNVVVSDYTNKKILDCGVKHCSNEVCLPVKVFHGHVYSLTNKADYIFIPRYTSLYKNEYTCPKFCGLPDMVRLSLKNGIKILEVKMHVDKYPEQTYESLKEMAKVLNINYKNISDAYENAWMVFTKSQSEVLIKRKMKAARQEDKTAICVLGHPYMINDKYLSMNLVNKLKDRDINVYTPDMLDHETKRKNAYLYQDKVFWDVGLDNLGSAFTFAHDKNVRGIIYLTPFACGVDSFVTEFIELRLKSFCKIPFMKITVDEHTGEAGFDTRIEAFLDMLGGLLDEGHISPYGKHVYIN